MLAFFANIFGYVLKLLYNIVGNYGWAIILFLDRTKNPIFEKKDKSFITKKYKLYEDYFNDDINSISIFEIYLNDLYSNLDKTISICENEEIQDDNTIVLTINID